MTQYDYSIFRRQCYSPVELSTLKFDLLVSAFNRSERVQRLWDLVGASKRLWINHPEYGIDSSELPESDLVYSGPNAHNEIDFWSELFGLEIFENLPRDASLAFDITGMMRPHVIALPLSLALKGFKSGRVLYSDPSSYVDGTSTTFAIGPVVNVSTVNGFEGLHNTGVTQSDLLVIGSGYDDQLIRAAAESKRAAEQILLLGLPSLQPHMYQESLLRLHKASESINNYSRRSHLYAPANDPFVTAGVLSEYLKARPGYRDLNVYLCPTGPKTQVLGFAWYFLCEAAQSSTSLIFPYSHSYAPETSTGIGRTRAFDLELECIDLAGFLS